MLQKEDGTVCFRKVSKDVKIEAGHFLTLMDVDDGAEFDRYFEFSPSARASLAIPAWVRRSPSAPR